MGNSPAPMPGPAPNPATTPATSVDLFTERCPMTYVRARLALDRAPPGSVLRIRVGTEEARHNLAANATRLGHRLLTQTEDPAGGTWLSFAIAGTAEPHA